MSLQHSPKAKRTFCLTSPNAHSVLLAGDFTGWERHPIPLRKEEGGIWKTTVALDPGEHRYRFVVDGEWCDDPECTARVANPYGSQDMISLVG